MLAKHHEKSLTIEHMNLTLPRYWFDVARVIDSGTTLIQHWVRGYQETREINFNSPPPPSCVLLAHPTNLNGLELGLLIFGTKLLQVLMFYTYFIFSSSDCIG